MPNTKDKRKSNGAASPPPSKAMKADAALVPPSAATPQGKELTAHLLHVHESLTVIRNCAIFDGIHEELPLTIAEGGNQAPYSKRNFSQILGQNADAKFSCGGNFMWSNPSWLANHRVPVNTGQVKHFQLVYFPYADPPLCNPFTQTVAVDNCDFNVEDNLGSLQRISPEEIDHALVFSIAESISKLCSDDVLKRCRAYNTTGLQSTPNATHVKMSSVLKYDVSHYVGTCDQSVVSAKLFNRS